MVAELTPAERALVDELMSREGELSPEQRQRLIEFLERKREEAPDLPEPIAPPVTSVEQLTGGFVSRPALEAAGCRPARLA